MAILTINGKSYDMDRLSEDAKAQVTRLQFVDAELARLNATMAVYQTARSSYINALLPHLEIIGDHSVTIQ